MSKKKLYSTIVKDKRDLGESERFIEERLRSAMSVIYEVARKKRMSEHMEEPPKSLAWAFTYGEIEILEASEKAIRFITFSPPSKSGAFRGEHWTIPRDWIHLSNRQVGNRTRQAIRDYKSDLEAQELTKMEKAYEKLLASERDIYKKISEHKKILLDTREQSRKLKKTLEFKRARRLERLDSGL